MKALVSFGEYSRNSEVTAAFFVTRSLHLLLFFLLERAGEG
jgi:hypothetical protein